MMKKLNKVAGYRAMLGLSQREIAELFGISKQAYSAKERGFTNFNKSEMIIFKNLLVEHIPGISIDEIFFD